MLISICSLVAIVGCTQKEVDNSQKVENSDETIKVMEDVYVDYINDIYLDSSKYIGKTIEIEGLFTVEKDKNEDEIVSLVMDKYQVDFNQAKGDVDDFLKYLRDVDII